MRAAAKWFIVIWTLLCLAGGSFTCFAPLWTAAQQSDDGRIRTQDEENARTIVAGGCATCGVFGWFGLWLVGTIPGLVFYVIGKPSDAAVSPGEAAAPPPIAPPPAVLCVSCGKYYPGTSGYCPHCGHARG